MTDLPGPADPYDIGLAQKVAFLSRPESYPERPRRVATVESHMSWVFLTDAHAYKLKKPVRYAFLDFSTPDARRRDCEEEVRLNRRLAPEVYLGTVPLARTPDGLRLGGPGAAVDWLVKMVRLPADRTLEAAIARRSLREADLQAVGTTLARFYREAEAVPVDPDAWRQRFAADAAASLEAVAATGDGARLGRARRIAAAQAAFLARSAPLLDRRVREGRIVEGHGDLRPEHVYLDGRPTIIDCLEFDRALRTVDPADELGFLALECERLGAGWAGAPLLAAYARASRDAPPARLIDFYRSFRALQRARLAIWHMSEPLRHTPQHWLDRADEYLALAAAYAARL